MQWVFLGWWCILAVYIVLGNYLYFAKVLPAIGENPSGLPSRQLVQVRCYLSLVDRSGERPWFLPYLRNIGKISLAMAVVMVGIFVVVWGGLAR
jgi:hypothetical protein